jgi:hypothetical protein
MSDVLSIRIVGNPDDEGFVRLDDFNQFCRSLRKCLRRVDDVVRPDGPRVQYRITDMQAQSAALKLEPVLRELPQQGGKVVLRLFRDTVTRLQAGKPVDHRFTFDDLETFRELVIPLKQHSSQVWVDGSQLGAEYAANIDRILGSAVPSQGQVTGRLERVNVHERYEFVLFPVAGSPIKCKFGEKLLDQVRKGIKRTVTVSGTLFFQPDKPFPDRANVAGMEIHPRDDDVPSLMQLRGIAPKCTGDRSAVEFVRAIRDE